MGKTSAAARSDALHHDHSAHAAPDDLSDGRAHAVPHAATHATLRRGAVGRSAATRCGSPRLIARAAARVGRAVPALSCGARGRRRCWLRAMRTRPLRAAWRRRVHCVPRGAFWRRRLEDGGVRRPLPCRSHLRARLLPARHARGQGQGWGGGRDGRQRGAAGAVCVEGGTPLVALRTGALGGRRLGKCRVRRCVRVGPLGRARADERELRRRVPRRALRHGRQHRRGLRRVLSRWPLQQHCRCRGLRRLPRWARTPRGR